MHIIAVGSNMAHKRELDTEAVGRAELICVDSISQAKVESGNLIQAISEGRSSWESVVELGNIITAPDRPNHQGITLFESLGIAALDVAVAHHVYRMARTYRRGQELDIEGGTAVGTILPLSPESQES